MPRNAEIIRSQCDFQILLALVYWNNLRFVAVLVACAPSPPRLHLAQILDVTTHMIHMNGLYHICIVFDLGPSILRSNWEMKKKNFEKKKQQQREQRSIHDLIYHLFRYFFYTLFSDKAYVEACVFCTLLDHFLVVATRSRCLSCLPTSTRNSYPRVDLSKEREAAFHLAQPPFTHDNRFFLPELFLSTRIESIFNGHSAVIVWANGKLLRHTA